MKFKELTKKLQERNEEGKPETTKKYAEATPGQNANVVFTPDPAYDAVKIAKDLDPVTGHDIKHAVDQAVKRQDKDADGDVDDQDKNTPDEVTGAEKKNKTLELLKKGAAERAHTKKGVAYESVEEAKDSGSWKKSDKWTSISKKNGKPTDPEGTVHNLAGQALKKSMDMFSVQMSVTNPENKKTSVHKVKLKASDAQDAVKKAKNYFQKKGMTVSGAGKAMKEEVQIQEGAVKQMMMDMEELSPEEFKRKYNMTKADAQRNMSKNKPAAPAPTMKKEETEQIDEAEDKTLMRLKQLVRLGLMDKSKLPLLVRSMNNLQDKGKVTNPAERELLFDLVNDLVGLVTGDDSIFAKIRMSVQS